MRFKVPFGSYVYGKTTVNSDADYYIISDEFEGYENFKDTNGDDIHHVSFDYYKNMLDDHDIAALEIYSYSKEVEEFFDFNFDCSKLRKSISAVVSNSWVKSKKKMLVEKQDYIGRKSMWHSLRILMFGVQIAKHKKIVDFSEANMYYDDIVLSNDSYDILKERYHPIMLNKQTEFRILAPKGL